MLSNISEELTPLRHMAEAWNLANFWCLTWPAVQLPCAEGQCCFSESVQLNQDLQNVALRFVFAKCWGGTCSWSCRIVGFHVPVGGAARSGCTRKPSGWLTEARWFRDYKRGKKTCCPVILVEKWSRVCRGQQMKHFGSLGTDDIILLQSNTYWTSRLNA